MTAALVVARAEPAVQEHSGIVGWDLQLNVGSVWLTSEHCAETPLPGEPVTLECDSPPLGFGQRITGIVIGGRRYR